MLAYSLLPIHPIRREGHGALIRFFPFPQDDSFSVDLNRHTLRISWPQSCEQTIHSTEQFYAALAAALGEAELIFTQRGTHHYRSKSPAV